MKRTLRLFIIGIHWPPETFIKRKLDGLADTGIDITVCLSGPAPARRNSNMHFLRLYPANRRTALAATMKFLIQLVRYPSQMWRAWRSIRSTLQNRKSALLLFLQSSELIGQNPDIIHFEWNSAAVDFLPVMDYFDCPIVISCRGAQVQIAPYNPNRQDLAQGLRTTFQKATAVHCVSEAIKIEAQKFDLDPAKAHIIRPAVDPDFFFPQSKSTENPTPVIISTGSLIWRKGYEYALCAIRELLNSGYDVKYQIVGDGSERQRLLYTIFDLGLESQVELLGKLSPVEVRDHLQRADIFLLPSLSEGISNAVLEAMACGLPIVTTDCGGMREAVTDGVEGFVVPTRNSSEMMQATRKMLTDPELRLALGAAARKRILNEFTLEKQIEAFSELYFSLVKE